MPQLLPWQKDGVAWARGVRGPVCLNDETGLGKTWTAMAMALDKGCHKGIIVVNGTILQHKWLHDLEAMGLRGQYLRNAKAAQHGLAPWLVVSYESIKHSLGPVLKRIAGGVSCIVFDESDALKSRNAKRTIAWRQYVRLVQDRRNQRPACKVLLVTATPMDNPLHIISQYEVAGLDNEARQLRACTKWRFNEHLNYHECVGWKDEAAACALLQPRRLRRRKTDVFDSDVLPPMVEQRMPVPVNARKLWASVEARLCDGKGQLEAELRAAQVFQFFTDGPLSFSSQARAVVQAALLESSMLKAAAVAEYVAHLAAQEQVVVFAKHRQPIETCAKLLQEQGVITRICHGGFTDKERLEAVQQFKDGKAQVLVASYRTAGVGIDLINARRLVVLEQDWNPAVMQQAFNRIHRIGQTGLTYADIAVGQGSGELLRIENKLVENHSGKIEAADGAGYIGSLGQAVEHHNYNYTTRELVAL